MMFLFIQKWKLSYPRNATITKHSSPEAPKVGEMGNKYGHIQYETADAQTRKNCNRKTALELSAGKELGLGRGT